MLNGDEMLLPIGLLSEKFSNPFFRLPLMSVIAKFLLYGSAAGPLASLTKLFGGYLNDSKIFTPRAGLKVFAPIPPNFSPDGERGGVNPY